MKRIAADSSQAVSKAYVRSADGRLRPITLGTGHWLVAGAGLLLILLFVVVFVALPEWQNTHLTTVRGPKLQRCLGFAAERRSMPGGDWDLLTITGLQLESPLAAAGVKVDDVPIGYQHGVETGFYGDLESVVAGEDTVVRVVARADFPRGPDAWRTVRIEGRRMTCE